jgi:hypothetical protein
VCFFAFQPGIDLNILGCFSLEIVDSLFFDMRVGWASLIVLHSQKHKATNEVTVVAFDKY